MMFTDRQKAHGFQSAWAFCLLFSLQGETYMPCLVAESMLYWGMKDFVKRQTPHLEKE